MPPQKRTSAQPPHILRKNLLSGAREAQGVAIIIDVYRAFTSAALMMYLGAEQIILLAEPEAVLKIKAEKGYLAVGEVDGKKVNGFDLGNSPSHILAAGQDFFSGRTVAQRTSAGVTGAVAASHQSEMVILGSYVTARAIAQYVQELAPPVVSLVAMGAGGKIASPEDEACADYIEHLLTNSPYNHITSVRQIVEHKSTQKFLRGDQTHFPQTDPIYCLQRDVFDFIIVATRDDKDLSGKLVARRIDIPGRI